MPRTPLSSLRFGRVWVQSDCKGPLEKRWNGSIRELRDLRAFVPFHVGEKVQGTVADVSSRRPFDWNG